MTSMGIYFLLLLSSIFVCKIFGGDSVHWNYKDHDPLEWSKKVPLCAGQRQSPIDLPWKTTSKQFPPFVFAREFNTSLLFNLKNNGRTIVAELVDQKSTGTKLTVSGGGLPSVFHFTNFYLYWNALESAGSEHSVGGEDAAGEAQFVFTNLKSKQIAILSFFVIDSDDQKERAWRPYVDNAVKLIQKGTPQQASVNLMELMENQDKFQHFWKYFGSLTSPPCTENIIWIVFKLGIKIAKRDLKLLSSNVLHKAFRPIQLRNNRIIYNSVT